MAARGLRKAKAIQMAKPVFFCPSAWPPLMRSPERPPSVLPRTKWTVHMASPAPARATSSQTWLPSLAMVRAVWAVTMASVTPQR